MVKVFNIVVCGAALLLAALTVGAKPVKEETQALTFAQKAFQDGIYDVAALKLGAFLKDFPDSELAAEARVYLAQCHLFQGQPKKALLLLEKLPDGAPENLKPEFLFWQAEANFALKEWARAAALYRRVLEEYPRFPSAVKARLNLSLALLQTEGEEAALAALEPLLTDGVAPADRQQALLQKARILISGNKLAEVTLIVDKMAREKVDRKAQYQLWYWTAELARMSAKPAKAVEFYQKITADPRTFPVELIAKSWFGLGQVYKEQQKWAQASDAFQQAYAASNDEAVTQAAVMEFLGAQLKNDSLTQGAIIIRKAAREHGAAGVSGLYAIGLFYYNTGNYDAAIGELDGLATNHPSSEWSLPAQMLVAECFLKKNDAPAAVKILEKLGAQTADSQLALAAAFRLAELQAQGGGADEAVKNFLNVARKSADARQSENAYFQALMVMAKAGRTAEFAATQAEFIGKFPRSPRLAELAMEQARLAADAGKEEEARKIYQSLSQNKDNPEMAAESLYRLALSQYESGAEDEALKNLLALEQNFPLYRNSADAAYLRMTLQNRRGALSPDEFRAELGKLAARFPKNAELAAKAWFKVAELYFAQGNYAEAQTAFQQVAEKYPNSAYAEAAWYESGLCAWRLDRFDEAITVLEKKIPDSSPFKGDARMVQIRCYIRQNKWQDALRLADSVIASRQPDPVWADAALRKANCLNQLARDNPKQHDAALAVLNQILAAKNIALAQRNEAGCLKGDILAQQQKTTEALAAYLDVVYGRLLPSDVTGLPAEPEQYWFNRAGVNAAKLLDDKGDIKGEIQVYRILERLSEQFREEFRKKIDELKARHFIYEES